MKHETALRKPIRESRANPRASSDRRPPEGLLCPLLVRSGAACPAPVIVGEASARDRLQAQREASCPRGARRT